MSSALDRHVHHSESRPLVCTRAQAWSSLVDKIRHPEAYTGAHSVKIVEEGPNFVRREMTVGPPTGAMVMKERITWSEEEGLVRFTFDNDPMKTGKVDNRLTTNEAGQLVLTFDFTLDFTEAAPDDMVEGARKNIPKTAANALNKTVAIMEAL